MNDGHRKQQVWLYATEGTWQELAAALTTRGVVVNRISADIDEALLALYDSQGIMVVDTQAPGATTAIERGLAFLPLAAIAPTSAELSQDIYRLNCTLSASELAHHILELSSESTQFRRYPRVPVTLRALVDGVECEVSNVSLYGVFVSHISGLTIGTEFEMSVFMSDGARVNLNGRVVAARDTGLAVRTRPAQDIDLVVWLHLMLSELDKSPIYADADPFGPLFR
ncbi:MAG: PilZ domain-containing protein [Bradymonadia bacterium]